MYIYIYILVSLYLYFFVSLYLNLYILVSLLVSKYIGSRRKKVFVKDSMSKRKEMSFLYLLLPL